ncbi:flagellar basal body L-ring protein FlgH [Psychrosphaera ytuae]|uniref:Flagellar L-ring protein n=1 Tax=Psychrosphaera ytuae TaxID=2820710 RepID=A0A975DDZ5_9GAMM|nr:flagellar basal body L-ring protein FlgH [Psychrosphaera ytuae]
MTNQKSIVAATRTLFKASVIVAGFAVLTGCAVNHDVIEEEPFFAPIMPETPSETVVATGSLYQAGWSNGLYSDTKARRVGDIITVMLQENTQASKTAKTETKKETDASLSPLVGLNGVAPTIGGNTLQLGIESDGNFKGDAKSDQSNSLSGQITVHVLRVLPNGNLIIRGEKWLTLNTGQEFIRLTGIVRAEDISADNTVESTRVANARISYSGKGSLAETQEAGWLSKFFLSSMWPF